MTDIIADKNRVGLMGPEQAKKLAKALTTDTGQVLTAPTINGGLFTSYFGGLLDVRRANATSGVEFFKLLPTDYGTGNHGLYFIKHTTANEWKILSYDGTTTGVIDVQAATLSLNGSPVMTRGASEVITGLKTISTSDAATAGNYLSFKPTDYGVGKPQLYFNKLAGGLTYEIGLFDTVNTAGTIAFASTALTHNDIPIATTAGPVFTLPPRLPSYTVATVPSAATYVRGMIYVSDGASNKRMAISDGTNWRFPDGAIVS